jgi:hypothetical protein
VFEGLDDIDWSSLRRYGGTAEVIPFRLRRAAECTSFDQDRFDALSNNLLHEGAVSPAAIAAVPFLAELARSTSAERVHHVWLLGRLSDPRHAGRGREDSRAAVVGQLPVLTPLLDDPDPTGSGGGRLPAVPAPRVRRYFVEPSWHPCRSDELTTQQGGLT